MKANHKMLVIVAVVFLLVDNLRATAVTTYPSYFYESSALFSSGYMDPTAALTNSKTIATSSIDACSVYCVSNLQEGCNVYAYSNGDCLIGHLDDADKITKTEIADFVRVKFDPSVTLRKLRRVIPLDLESYDDDAFSGQLQFTLRTVSVYLNDGLASTHFITYAGGTSGFEKVFIRFLFYQSYIFQRVEISYLDPASLKDVDVSVGDVPVAVDNTGISVSVLHNTFCDKKRGLPTRLPVVFDCKKGTKGTSVVVQKVVGTGALGISEATFIVNA